MSFNEIATLIVALAAIFVSGVLTYKQADIALKEFTLSYIAMENADEDLAKARKWLLDPENSESYIQSFVSTKNFLEHKDIFGYEENSFPSKDLRDEYLQGIEYIQKILRVRQEAAEAIIMGIIHEDTYRLIRHGDFSADYSKLEDFIFERHQQKGDNFSVMEFRTLVYKWRETTFDIIATKNSTNWNEFYQKARYKIKK